MSNARDRQKSFGQDGHLSVFDKAGAWLSGHKLRRAVGDMTGKDVADVGCGFQASTSRRLLGVAASLTLVDVAVAEDLKEFDGVNIIEDLLPAALDGVADESLDVVLCVSVLEHLWEPEVTLAALFRVLRSGGVAFLNVPTWRGKRALEFSAFKLGLSPAAEMDDHKTYYDPRDLWPLIVRAGFSPHNIKVHRHKLGLNCYAVCRKEPD
jgi:SAM-dependent methyltransferase